MLNFFRRERVFSDTLTVRGGITRSWEYTKHAVATRIPRSQLWSVDLIEGGSRKRIGNGLTAYEVVAAFMEEVNTHTYNTWVPGRFSINGERNPSYKGERSKRVSRTFEPGESDCEMSLSRVSVSIAPRNSFRDHPEFAQFVHPVKPSSRAQGQKHDRRP